MNRKNFPDSGGSSAFPIAKKMKTMIFSLKGPMELKISDFKLELSLHKITKNDFTYLQFRDNCTF